MGQTTIATLGSGSRSRLALLVGKRLGSASGIAIVVAAVTATVIELVAVVAVILALVQYQHLYWSLNQTQDIDVYLL